MSVLNYTPPKSLEGFLTADKFVNLVVGPVGSTKTTASIIKVAYEAKRVAPCADGIRRSRACIIRNTREQLSDTTIPDWLKWFPDGVAGSYLRTERKFILRFDDVECEVLFRGLDDANDVRRLLSLQLSFGFMDEFREISMEIFNALQGRLGRYPDKSMNGVGCCDELGRQIDKVWGSSNPPDYDTPWEAYLSNPPANAAVFIQPSGLSPEADWLQYLKDDFYTNLMEGKPEDWIDVYVRAKFGKSLSGQPVFKSFDRATHIAKVPLKYNPSSNNPILVGFDLALNPAAVIGQMDYGGRLAVLDCLHASGMGALRFIRNHLKPLLVTKYAGARVMIICDPSGVRRMDTDESSVIQIIKAENLAVKPASTNRLAPRIAAVDNFLTRTVDGRSMITIDASCDILIKALAGKYRYRIKKPGKVDEQVDDEPEKLHPWSDIADALQYLCLHADGGAVTGATIQTSRREIQPSPFRWAM
jgi:hypothetical protein